MRNVNWTCALSIFVFVACGKKSYDSKVLSSEMCDCFNANIRGTVDERLTPCLQKIIDREQNEFNKSADNNVDSIKRRVSVFTLDILIELTRSCDKYFTEINMIYDNGYPLDSSATNKEGINVLTKRITSETNQDSIKSLLHKEVYKLIQARQYGLALDNISEIKSLDKDDYGSNLARAYIFNQTNKHDKAIVELEEAIKLSGKLELILYAEVTKRKEQIANKQ
jgi:hypothetical protein